MGRPTSATKRGIESKKREKAARKAEKRKAPAPKPAEGKK
jgi:hypothetical protein